MKKLMMIVVAVVAAAAFAEGRDGVMHSIEWSANNLASAVNWYDGVIAGEGGVATFEKSNYGTITQNIPGWTLSGLDTVDLSSKTVTGEAITFVGAAFLRNNGGTPIFLCNLEGSAGASLTKSGAGTMQLAQPLHGFVVVTNALGKLISTNDSGTCSPIRRSCCLAAPLPGIRRSMRARSQLRRGRARLKRRCSCEAPRGWKWRAATPQRPR